MVAMGTHAKKKKKKKKNPDWQRTVEKESRIVTYFWRKSILFYESGLYVICGTAQASPNALNVLL